MIKQIQRLYFFLSLGFVLIAVVDQLRRPTLERSWRGAILGIPYDFASPTFDRVFDILWIPEDPRVFTPRPFGIGWDVNLHRVIHMGLQAKRRLDAGDPVELA